MFSGRELPPSRPSTTPNSSTLMSISRKSSARLYLTSPARRPWPAHPQSMHRARGKRLFYPHVLVSSGFPGATVLQQGLDQVKVIRTASDEQAILAFNGAHKQIKEAIKRTSDLSAQLNEANLVILRNARSILHNEGAF